MKIVHSIEEMRSRCRAAKTDEQRLGFVPTMGALHAGHLALVRAARAQCKTVAVSIFVNPTQFGPNEDFAKYPRTLERDQKLLEAEGVSLLFVPTVDEMYPPGASTFVTVEGLSDKLCGRTRLGHFRGVATVVSKLFHIIEPDIAYFGQKDAAQAAILRKMVRDLAFNIEIVVVPTVREADGLAMSSRNAYLNAIERKQALVLYRALCRVQTLADRGERDAGKLAEAAKEVLRDEPAVRLDYIEIVDQQTLDPVADISKGALVAVAAFVGSARLIDNIVL
ncbi:MAG TPA: pantoate--beta-alanine ligase [Terriglobales bacterium]|nr:pantoate--beta-alanine ligase [Terriglobales bacterium]